jgi:hypothetical protein
VIPQNGSNSSKDLAGGGAASHGIEERIGDRVLLYPPQIGDDGPEIRPPLL